MRPHGISILIKWWMLRSPELPLLLIFLLGAFSSFASLYYAFLLGAASNGDGPSLPCSEEESLTHLLPVRSDVCGADHEQSTKRLRLFLLPRLMPNQAWE
ncbi:hypothetical protein BHE74_00016375 [Ensete ventricosum]|nr:hypothetical protein BHE74_00016375 [Ensete ventricosum]